MVWPFSKKRPMRYSSSPLAECSSGAPGPRARSGPTTPCPRGGGRGPPAGLSPTPGASHRGGPSRGTRIGGQVQAHHADAAGVADGVDQLVEHDRGLLLTAGGRGLVADGIDATVGPVVAECLGDLLGGVAVIEVDRLGADVL